MMKLLLVRHGQTNYNDLHLANADPSTDVYLTAVGQDQVKKLAMKLADVPIDQIYTSELKRTKQTADILNSVHNVPVKEDVRLGDIRTGYEGQSSDKYFTALDEAENRWTIRLNGGESLEDVKARVNSVIDDLRKTGFETVLIVTSRDVVSAFRCLLQGLSNDEAWEYHVDKASCLELELE